MAHFFRYCSTGSSRLIDYALVSHELQGLVRLGVAAVPWKPHTGIVAEIQGQPLSVTALQHREPQSLPNLSLLRKDKEFQEAVSPRVPTEGGVREACRQGAGGVPGQSGGAWRRDQ